MDYTVYFADKAVVFTAKTPGEDWYAVTPAPDGGISRAKVTKILESYNKAAVVTPDPGAAFGAFAAEFALIEAAGGVVVNDCGQWLMIRRNGRWDLPKGHLECGERIEECAAREIEEETGVRAGVVRPLCDTLHAYYFPKTERWELKRTHWYELHTASCDRLVPQAEEGIEQVCGVRPRRSPATCGMLSRRSAAWWRRWESSAAAIIGVGVTPGRSGRLFWPA